MPYYPVAPSSDDRSSRGAVPIVLRNMQLEKAPTQSAKGAGYYVTTTGGYRLRGTPNAGYNLRGLFARPGVQGGALFAVAGTTLYRFSASWSATAIGTISGSDTVLFDGLREKLLIVADGKLYTYDGTLLTQATDTDLSSDLYTLAVLGQRALTSPRDTDQIEWSSVLDALDWPSDAFTTSEIQPDAVEALVVVGDELYALNRATTQVYRAIGGADADSFDTFAGALVNKGCAARDTAQRVDAALFWLGDDRCLYRAAGADAQRIANRDMEAALAEMTAEQIAMCKAWVYTDGSKIFYVLRPPVGGRAWAFDVAEETWSERTTWALDAFRASFYAYANDRHVVAGPDDDGVYTMDMDYFQDGGEPLERVVMLHIPAPNNAVIASIGLDVKTFGQTVSGQGSDPEIMVTFYRDGGSVESVTQGLERQVKLGTLGQHGKRPTVWRFGQCAADGFLLKLRWTDPVGAAVYGVWINEGRA